MDVSIKNEMKSKIKNQVELINSMRNLNKSILVFYEEDNKLENEEKLYQPKTCNEDLNLIKSNIQG